MDPIRTCLSSINTLTFFKAEIYTVEPVFQNTNCSYAAQVYSSDKAVTDGVTG